MSTIDAESTALESLLLLVFPPIEPDGAEIPDTLLADLTHAKRFCRARLAHALADLPSDHCTQLLTERRAAVEALVRECADSESAGLPPTIEHIALRLRRLAFSPSLP